MAKGETLKAALEGLRNAIPELKGVLLASNEGLPIAHALTNGTDPNRLAAMAAAASTLGRKISDNIGAGNLGEVSVRADEGASVHLFRRHQSGFGGAQPARRQRRFDSFGSPRGCQTKSANLF